MRLIMILTDGERPKMPATGKYAVVEAELLPATLATVGREDLARRLVEPALACVIETYEDL